MKTENKEEYFLKGVMGIVFSIILIVFFVYYKNNSGEIEKNTNIEYVKEEEIFEEPESKILQNHLEMLNKIASSTDFDLQKKTLDEILIKKLEEKTQIPNFESEAFSVSEIYEKEVYEKEFAEQFSLATNSGMGLELTYFIAQVSPESGEILELSSQDKKDLERIAGEYERFGKKIQSLQTPTIYKKVSKLTTQKPLEINYILKQMLKEKDSLVYAMWFEKYTEAVRYIYKFKNDKKFFEKKYLC